MGTYTRARIVNNRFAKFKWVAKILVNKMPPNVKIRMHVIILRYDDEFTRVYTGNTSTINVKGLNVSIQSKFGSLYFWYYVSKKGFTKTCMFVGIDDYHSNNKYGWQLVIVISNDPKNQYFNWHLGLSKWKLRKVEDGFFNYYWKIFDKIKDMCSH